MAALDDLVAALVFFLVIAFVSAHISTQGIPVALVVLVVFLPVFLGIVTGLSRAAPTPDTYPEQLCSGDGRHAAALRRTGLLDHGPAADLHVQLLLLGCPSPLW